MKPKRVTINPKNITTKAKRVTIVNPAFLDILKTLKKEKFSGICGNRFCTNKFLFKWSFIKKKMIPHIKRCKKRKEKRGSYPWIEHYCEKCKKKFVWDLEIYIRIKGQEVQYKFELVVRKYLAPFDPKVRKLLGKYPRTPSTPKE